MGSEANETATKKKSKEKTCGPGIKSQRKYFDLVCLLNLREKIKIKEWFCFVGFIMYKCSSFSRARRSALYASNISSRRFDI